ncbi:unnamed protein product [Candidula unifasciata]|uniref:DUF1279 domain-containing protein n=1 Tax=Candidula unifasciata TaxID=100452 RepID=A0A8S3YGC8_9EUPU|nr:unnamed protein product [Candidula unifasciata]
MQTAARSTQRVYLRTVRQRSDVVKNAWSDANHVPAVVVVHCRPLPRNASGLSKACDNHRLKSTQNKLVQLSWFSDTQRKPEQTISLSEDACPQGIQGDDCVTFKLWLESCRRYGLANCNNQLQGIQSGRKTLSEVMVEQEKLISEIAEQYQAASQRHDTYSNVQGLQDGVAASVDVDVDMPCPQGVQGLDCARFKLWLENCHRFGLHDCAQQLDSFEAGRKSLAEVFAEQDKMIREAATVTYQKISRQQRKYSTSTRNPASGDRDPPGGSTSTRNPGSEDRDPLGGSTSTRNPGSGDSSPPGGPEQGSGSQLTQRQKLQRAVKEYGSTVIVFHVTISLMSLGFFYLLVSSGIDVVGLLMKLGIGESLLQNKLAAGTGTFVVAYAVHKVFAPVRIATTLTATPFIVRYLRRVGFLKVPQPVKPKQ